MNFYDYAALPVFQDTCTAAELAMSLCSQVRMLTCNNCIVENIGGIKQW